MLAVADGEGPGAENGQKLADLIFERSIPNV